MRLMEQHTHLLPDRLSLASGVMTSDCDPAPIWYPQGRYQPQQGRFAAAIGATEPQYLAGPHLEAQTSQH